MESERAREREGKRGKGVRRREVGKAVWGWGSEVKVDGTRKWVAGFGGGWAKTLLRRRSEGCGSRTTARNGTGRDAETEKGQRVG